MPLIVINVDATTAWTHTNIFLLCIVCMFPFCGPPWVHPCTGGFQCACAQALGGARGTLGGLGNNVELRHVPMCPP